MQLLYGGCVSVLLLPFMREGLFDAAAVWRLCQSLTYHLDDVSYHLAHFLMAWMHSHRCLGDLDV